MKDAYISFTSFEADANRHGLHVSIAVPTLDLLQRAADLHNSVLAFGIVRINQDYFSQPVHGGDEIYHVW